MNLNPPIFSEKKLQEILKYTDLDNNPIFDSYKSDVVFEIHSGAKGVSKSYSGAIISIYRLVNENIFCSMWCRNQYSHIKKTLKPMFENVLGFLKNNHNLDYFPFIKIYENAIYWDFDDGGIGRAIYFENFEKIQAFQGITLKSKNFRFGELVLDEPIEDPVDSLKKPYELIQLYELQEKKLPLLIQNTVNRNSAPDNFKIKVKFFYNIFTTHHFLIQNYHKPTIPFIDEFDTPNEKFLNQLIDNKYLQKFNYTFFDHLGIVVNMFSKFFIPKNQISEIQRKSLENLRAKDYRLWLITVAGFAFKDEKNESNYYMRPILYNFSGELSKNIKIIHDNDFENELINGKIIGIFDGFDPGLSDKSSWVRVALNEDAEIIILQIVEDLKKHLKNNITRNNINKLLASIIEQHNFYLEKLLKKANIVNENFTEVQSFLFCDNDIIVENLNLIFQQNKINAQAFLAKKRDSNKSQFGIISRQNWQKNIFENCLIKFLNNESLKLIKNLSFQVIEPFEKKRNENIHPEIYDLINAFEMACSELYKYQYLILERKINNDF